MPPASATASSGDAVERGNAGGAATLVQELPSGEVLFTFGVGEPTLAPASASCGTYLTDRWASRKLRKLRKRAARRRQGGASAGADAEASSGSDGDEAGDDAEQAEGEQEAAAPMPPKQQQQTVGASRQASGGAPERRRVGSAGVSGLPYWCDSVAVLGHADGSLAFCFRTAQQARARAPAQHSHSVKLASLDGAKLEQVLDRWQEAVDAGGPADPSAPHGPLLWQPYWVALKNLRASRAWQEAGSADAGSGSSDEERAATIEAGSRTARTSPAPQPTAAPAPPQQAAATATATAAAAAAPGAAEQPARGDPEPGGPPSSSGGRSPPQLSADAYACTWEACTVRGHADGTFVYKFHGLGELSPAERDPQQRALPWSSALRLGTKFPSQAALSLDKLAAFPKVYLEQQAAQGGPPELAQRARLDFCLFSPYDKVVARLERQHLGKNEGEQESDDDATEAAGSSGAGSSGEEGGSSEGEGSSKEEGSCEEGDSSGADRSGVWSRRAEDRVSVERGGKRAARGGERESGGAAASATSAGSTAACDRQQGKPPAPRLPEQQQAPALPTAEQRQPPASQSSDQHRPVQLQPEGFQAAEQAAEQLQPGDLQAAEQAAGQPPPEQGKRKQTGAEQPPPEQGRHARASAAQPALEACDGSKGKQQAPEQRAEAGGGPSGERQAEQPAARECNEGVKEATSSLENGKPAETVQPDGSSTAPVSEALPAQGGNGAAPEAQQPALLEETTAPLAGLAAAAAAAVRLVEVFRAWAAVAWAAVASAVYAAWSVVRRLHLAACRLLPFLSRPQWPPQLGAHASPTVARLLASAAPPTEADLAAAGFDWGGRYRADVPPLADLPAWRLEALLGCGVRDVRLYRAALTHASVLQPELREQSYERLEFLGDSVLEVITRQLLMARDPGADEGVLTRQSQALVSGPRAARFAHWLGLHRYCVANVSNMWGEAMHERPNVLADAFEALLGAIFQDQGLEAARAFLLRVYEACVDWAELEAERDWKSVLSRHAKAHGHTQPRYVHRKAEKVSSWPSGTAKRKQWRVDCIYMGLVMGSAVGQNKNSVESHAAHQAYLALPQHEPQHEAEAAAAAHEAP